MASVITNDSTERTKLSTWRTIGATMSGMLIGIIAPMLVFARNEAGQQIVVPEKFTVTGIIFGALSAAFYLGCYKLTTERVQIGQAAAAGLGGFLLTAIGYVSSTAGETVVQTDAVKMGIYNCMNLLPAVLTLLSFVIMFFCYPLGKKQVEENTRILAERRAAK